ncbi:uncharacterized protein JNUCC1_03714 [Lentibacillus sp. JNUCC-1]|uniref:VrrA/YqfQ family protein n=1 Tax=Lentibacillus sp. JNUCC-1 TaxID=2654513 RepID=UPI0012E87B6D|nr:VrrA/YqfQ family protein [Lentibacillus sp. JNUCC-1]MUV39830.1 uncharacterized protein [Lentibacillus sp. JNUCC-1]
MAIPFRRMPVNMISPQPPRNSYPVQPQPAYQSTGLLQQLLGGAGGSSQIVSADGIMNTLNHVQRILGFVQSTAPVLQEYGPLIKNLPAMYQMMKALDSNETDNLNSDDESEVEQTTRSEDASEEPVSISDSEPKVEQPLQGQSVPKLFI